METLTANLIGSKVRRALLHGREYAVAPVTMLVPGVLNGSVGPLYYPPELIPQVVDGWNGMPVVVYHPTHQGKFVSARRPDVMNTHGIGSVYAARVEDGKLRAEAWFDVETTRRVDPRVMTALDSGQPIEVSTGLESYVEPVLNPAEAVHNGTKYTHVVKGYAPDHLAVLPDQTGACSLKDGCGVLNSYGAEPKPDTSPSDAAAAPGTSTDKPVTTETPTPPKETPMAFDRTATITFLTANCDCWKGEGDRALLEGMPDAALAKLEAQAKKSAPTPVNNASNSTNTVATTNSNQPAPVAAPVARPQTMQDWLNVAPADAIRTWNSMVNLERQQRATLVTKLTANVAEGERKQSLIQLLSAKSVEELEALVALVPAPAGAQPAYDPILNPAPLTPTANYLALSGAPAPTPVNNGVKDEDDDLLQLPTYNWSAESATQQVQQAQ